MNASEKNNYFVHESSYIDENAAIGNETKIWHFSHILSGAAIGRHCNLGQNVCISGGVTIGDNVKIQNNVSVYEGTIIEDDVFLGPSCVLTNVSNPRSQVTRKNLYESTLIKKGASIGANATIICGVVVGRYAFVAAGAVVTDDIPDYAMVMGVPAKQQGWMSRHGHKLENPDKQGIFICPESHLRYKKNAQGIMHCIDLDEDNPLTPEMAKGKFSYRHLPEKNQDLQQMNSQLQFIDLDTQQKRIYHQLDHRIKTVLSHGKYIMGPEVFELEQQLSDFTGSKHAITCASGTDALLMGLMAKGVGPGDAIFTTPFTFIATAETISLLGATPVFVDISLETFNMNPNNLEQAIAALLDMDRSKHPLPSTASGGRSPLQPKGIIGVDLFGLPADYLAINKIAQKYDLFVMEDAAQSFGATMNNTTACNLADISTTSFFPAKPLGCYGDGGAVFTNDDHLAEKLRSIRIHGKGNDKYDNVRIGINGRLDTLQAAILLAKLKIFPDEIVQRNRVAESYTRHLSGTVQTPMIPNGFSSVWAQYSILSENRTHLQKMLEKAGVPTAIYYPKPLHLQTAYSFLEYQQEDFPVSEYCAANIFSLPMHPYLKEQQIFQIITTIKDNN